MVTQLHFDPCITVWCLPWEHYVLPSAPRAVLFTQLASVPAGLQQLLTSYSVLIPTCLLPWSGEEEEESIVMTAEVVLPVLGWGGGQISMQFQKSFTFSFFFCERNLNNSLRINPLLLNMASQIGLFSLSSFL